VGLSIIEIDNISNDRPGPSYPQRRYISSQKI